MRQTHFPPRVLAAVLSACATESVILNSERIEQRFGSYGIDVLASEAGLRRSSLFSYDGDSRTCRTYAVVQFAEEAGARCDAAHSRVLAGDSIGETFKEDGWNIRKHTLYVGAIRLPESHTEVGALMRLRGAHDLALHIYQLVLVRDINEFEYATILEAHHPDYLTERDLCSIFVHEPIEPLAHGDLERLSTLLFGA
ncbi:MAG: hypothetical protein QNJ14_13605 [Woeseiaceae bacterium]|nr:hypothetical protein [Woeseiaceae bacterium]